MGKALADIVSWAKKVLRIINNVGFYEHTNALFRQCKLLKFAEVVKAKTACVMFKAYHNELHPNVQNHFEVGTCANIYGTRQKDKFKTNSIESASYFGTWEKSENNKSFRNRH